MRKFVNVDIIDTLHTVVKQNTQHYQSDFEYDKETFTQAATSKDANSKHLLWLSRTSGTWCLNERAVFILENEAHNTWTYYSKTQDTIRAFAVEVSGLVSGKPMGTIYELDYERHAEHISKMALPAKAVALTFESGTVQTFPYEEYNHNWPEIFNMHGNISNSGFEVKDESALQTLLQEEHKMRSKFPSRSVVAFVKELQPKKVSVTERLNQAKQIIKPIWLKNQQKRALKDNDYFYKTII